jgi:CubicO group peptidase (beta-lactamase class C family)
VSKDTLLVWRVSRGSRRWRKGALLNCRPKWRFSRRDLLKTALAASAAIALPVGREVDVASAIAELATPIAGDELDALFAELDDFVVTRMAKLKIPGVAIGVIAGDREHAMGFGVTNVDHPLPVDANTLFQIGSTTKTFTGTTVMRLVEHGKLDLEAPVRTYLPNFRVADSRVSERVRLRHLVTHTAGWQDAGFVETGDGDDALARYIAGMADLPQIAPLGKYFSYNNSALCLVGHVIEAVTRQPYEAAVTELVLKPLGLEQISFFPEAIMTKAFAVGHGAPQDDPQGEPVVLEPWALPRSVNPAGGLVASVEDMLRYARFHLGDRTANGTQVLSAESLQRMQTPLGPGGSVPGLGVVRLEGVGVTWNLWSRGGVRIVSHPGGTSGQLSTFFIVPEHGFALSILTNAQAGILLGFEVTDWVLERFLGLEPPLLATVPLDPARLSKYAGEYALPNGSEPIRIREEGGALQLVTASPLLSAAQTDIALSLRIVGDDVAIAEYMGVPLYADFVRDDAGNVAWVRFLGRLVPRAM